VTRKRKPSARLIWLTGIVLALAVHAAGLLVFRVEKEEAEVPEADYSFANLSPLGDDGSQTLHEWAYLFDTSPLFFPTRWNASGASVATAALDQRPEPLFLPFPARLSYGERDFGLGAIVSVQMETPLEILRGFDDPVRGVFGEGKVEIAALEERFALVEVLAPDGSGAILEKTIPVEGAPKIGARLWAPAEFLVQVVPTGRLGEPVRVRGTGIEAVDHYLGTELLSLLEERMLEPGYYRVRIGP